MKSLISLHLKKYEHALSFANSVHLMSIMVGLTGYEYCSLVHQICAFYLKNEFQKVKEKMEEARILQESVNPEIVKKNSEFYSSLIIK